ncbi:MAG: indolepyruvate ferredoxin oxidoreductase family protein [Rhodospirillaceae bacterium]|jgi:indolepyruvate ferredoxin oxidoreductase|nr:indolepyruvate ferredoxin oxidoreductase family protein [Rhodospirillaceae bacterium]MBT3491703.1 indolepyruvate ferredoxin oxidoreductase family protein [Rhodospirillaceae bacterium]MBT3783241.1 indolepyruvate ferredoxin oxidoreductase family protein [Rhodospirillaceae bacterium]MBT3978237.1 indolepyruvate ferredoxin oxidoreductase family protein [Rhodospirillaceae bacterium]MBT4168950.1 indolepyruvate ferredoxin oxidoreductase family protein [Rhodospirillaceae bacterium]
MTSATTALANVSLDDKYALEKGRVFLTGTQAMVRLPMLQRQRDQAAGLNTGCYISGYRGSPLGAFDQQLWQAKPFLEKNHIVFQPGVNEDMAATAVWGSQQLNLGPQSKYDGVYGIWYGKAPGVDRCGDVVRHANHAGTDPNGGVLMMCGDDHAAVSSTVPGQSEHNLASWMVPMLYPAGVQEYLDYGLLGWAMSRYAGVWVGFKCVSEVVESSASVDVDAHRLDIQYPDFEMPEGGLNIRWPDDRWSQEIRLQRHKVYAALAFARANGIDRLVWDAPKPRIGIVAAGKSYLDTRQALEDLGIDEAMAAQIGLRLYKVGMPWPLEREGIRAFAEGLDEVLVIEEKRAVIENQLKEQLYNWRSDVRPRVVGKFDEDGQMLCPSDGELSPGQIARIIMSRIGGYVTSPTIEERMAQLDRKEAAAQTAVAPIQRAPYFCSGCPHNTSTKVPEGSRAMAGIGCHFMALFMDRSTETFTQMGGEGVPWLGQAAFTGEEHIFTNLGDGTYYHSGITGIRAAVASGVNITYKILFNDAVAMTGGQPHDGPLNPWQISQQVHHEGASKIIVVTDEPDKYPTGTNWAPGVTIRHRDELDRVQKELRKTLGCSVLIYDQTCAAEKRRRRKRGTFPDPDRRAFINEAVCEGCGDCSVQSNCVSVEPLETSFGRKRQINQSACNKDFSCIKGFCPSFVTVSGAVPRRAQAASAEALDTAAAALPDPTVASAEGGYNILVTGIGGTGVITVGALLGMAAHVEGKGVTVLDFTGIAQKNGAVMSHIRIAPKPEDLHAVRIAAGGADLLLGADMVAAAAPDSLRKLSRGGTQAIINSHLAPTADFTLNPDTEFHGEDLRGLIRNGAGDNRTEFVDATGLATALMGDAIAANLFLLGHAYQRGALPVSGDAIDKAIELNGVAVAMNRRAFALGRLAAEDLDQVSKMAQPAMPAKAEVEETLDDIINHRAAVLTEYQDADYAAQYLAFVRQVETAEQNKGKGMTGLTEAVARNLFKVMAYKDEYEVARLYTGEAFQAALAQQFDGDLKLKFHLAPPLLAKRDPDSGELIKREYGPWVMTAFKLLTKMKGLRGGTFDIFGRTEERRAERAAIPAYRAVMEEVLTSLTPDNHALAREIASIPAKIRGYGHIKERSQKAAAAEQAQLLEAWRNPLSQPSAAE